MAVELNPPEEDENWAIDISKHEGQTLVAMHQTLIISRAPQGMRIDSSIDHVTIKGFHEIHVGKWKWKLIHWLLRTKEVK